MQLSTTPKRRISTRFTRKGALIDETYAIFRVWDRQRDIRANLARIRDENPIGARNGSWLREITTTISSRFRTDKKLLPLVILAQGGLPLDPWRSCLLWHIGQQDELFYKFLTEWLYLAHERGTYRIRSEDVLPFVIESTIGRPSGGKELSEYGRIRAARDLLLMAADFGLLKGSVAREFASFHLPDDCFLYILHALAEQELSPRRIIEAPEWRMYLLAPDDVERELLRLHQFQRVEYQAAGSLVQLKLPYGSLLAYAEGLVA